MELIELATADLDPWQVASTRRLLDAAFAGDFAEEDWQHALGGTHILVVRGDEVIAHGAVVARVLELNGEPIPTGYVEAVATLPAHQRAGHGSRVMERINAVIRGGYRLGALSTLRQPFYERLGWERWQGPTFVRRGSELVRTADEDDGIMVLRVADVVETSLPIVCQGRVGDDW